MAAITAIPSTHPTTMPAIAPPDNPCAGGWFACDDAVGPEALEVVDADVLVSAEDVDTGDDVATSARLVALKARLVACGAPDDREENKSPSS